MSLDEHVTVSNGSRVSYADVGDPEGSVVLYLHGTPGSRMQASGPLSATATRLGLRLIAPDRPGYGGSTSAPYDVGSYPAMVASFADALGIDRFGVVGTSGGGRYAFSCGQALADRVTRVALVASTAPSDLRGVRETWSHQDRRLYTMASRAPWLLRAALMRTARSLRRHPERMLAMVPATCPADQTALQREDVRSLVTAMTAEAFRQGGGAFVRDVRLEALPWNLRPDPLAVPVDVWHGRDDTIVRCEQAELLAETVPAAHRHFLHGEGHFSLVMLRSSDYLLPFCQSAPDRAPR